MRVVTTWSHGTIDWRGNRLDDQAGPNLPDLILADLGPPAPLLVFVEVVATAGPVNEARQTALTSIAGEGGFGEDQVAFVTAYADRDDAVFVSSVGQLAWRSFAWFMSEPDDIMVLCRGTHRKPIRLSKFLRMFDRSGSR